MCPACGDHQYAKNSMCRKCGQPKEAAALGKRSATTMMGNAGMSGNMRPGDWVCKSCGDHQFAKNQNCRKCNAPKPNGMTGNMMAGMMAGLMGGNSGGNGLMGGNMGGNGVGNMKPGDWQCAQCGDHNFAKNTA